MTHIVCFHLYNDFSGSPIVLRMVLDGLLQHGYQVDLVTSDGGVLDTGNDSANTRTPIAFLPIPSQRC